MSSDLVLAQGRANFVLSKIAERVEREAHLYVSTEQIFEPETGGEVVDALCNNYLLATRPVVVKRCTLQIEPYNEAIERLDLLKLQARVAKLGQALARLPELTIEFVSFGSMNLFVAGHVLQSTLQVTEIAIKNALMRSAVAVFDGVFCEGLGRLPNLKKLLVRNLRMSVDLQQAIVTNIPSLESFDYREGRPLMLSAVQPDFVRQLVALPSMRRLCLRHCSLSGRQVGALCQSLSGSGLEQLSLLDCWLPRDFAQRLAVGLAPNRFLQSLVIRLRPDSRIFWATNDGPRLGKALARHPAIEEFDLTMPSRRSVAAEELGACIPLLQGLATRANLKTLRLSRVEWNSPMCESLQTILQNGLSSLRIAGIQADEEWQALYPSLRFGRHLEQLAIVDNRFHHNAIATGQVILSDMKAVLGTATKVQELTLLFYSQCSGSSLADFVQSLPRSCNLNSIWVEFAPFVTPHGMKWSVDSPALVVNALKSNYKLVKLGRASDPEKESWVRSPLLDVEAYQSMLDGLLAMNQQGRDYVLSDPHNMCKRVDVLGTVSENLNCLFLHLRENPWSY